MRKMRSIMIVVALTIVSLMVGCGNKKDKEIDELKAKYESLESNYSNLNSKYNELESRNSELESELADARENNNEEVYVPQVVEQEVYSEPETVDYDTTAMVDYDTAAKVAAPVKIAIIDHNNKRINLYAYESLEEAQTNYTPFFNQYINNRQVIVSLVGDGHVMNDIQYINSYGNVSSYIDEASVVGSDYMFTVGVHNSALSSLIITVDGVNYYTSICPMKE